MEVKICAPKRKLEVINHTFCKDTPLTDTCFTCQEQLHIPLKKHLAYSLSATNADVKQVVTSWLQTSDNDFLYTSPPWWATCLNINGDYMVVCCAPSEAYVSCMYRRQNTVLGAQRYFSWYSLLPWYIPRLNPSKSLVTHLTSHPIISHIISIAEIPAINNIIINWWTCDSCSFHVYNGSSVAETYCKTDTKLGDSSSTRWRRVDWYADMFLRRLLHCKS
jgi:hypothetical protein